MHLKQACPIEMHIFTYASEANTTRPACNLLSETLTVNALRVPQLLAVGHIIYRHDQSKDNMYKDNCRCKHSTEVSGTTPTGFTQSEPIANNSCCSRTPSGLQGKSKYLLDHLLGYHRAAPSSAGTRPQWSHRPSWLLQSSAPPTP